jgi:hypothetical protein
MARLAASRLHYVEAMAGWDIKQSLMRQRLTLCIVAAGAVGLVLLHALAWTDVGGM